MVILGKGETTMKKGIAFVLALMMALSLCACGGAKNSGPQTYYARDAKLMLDGEVLSGDDAGVENIWLTVDGDNIVLSYFGREYAGHRRTEDSQIIDWDDEPYLLEDSSVMMTGLLEVSNNDGFVGYDLNFDLIYSGILLVYQVELRK